MKCEKINKRKQIQIQQQMDFVLSNCQNPPLNLTSNNRLLERLTTSAKNLAILSRRLQNMGQLTVSTTSKRTNKKRPKDRDNQKNNSMAKRDKAPDIN